MTEREAAKTYEEYEMKNYPAIKKYEPKQIKVVVEKWDEFEQLDKYDKDSFGYDGDPGDPLDEYKPIAVAQPVVEPEPKGMRLISRRKPILELVEDD